MEDLAARVVAGELRALARAATLVENRGPQAEPLLKALFPYTGRAMTVGVTGPPGAGKSTVVDQLVRQLRAEGQTVGVVAVDPSSPFTGGAILGDRIRMQAHHADPGVFIRSMATRGALGGLARATLDLAMLMDAAGRQTVLIETVGVGQDEVEIARLADVTVVVLVPGMGDDVQAIKAGILEIADVFVINKADQPGAQRLEQELRGMMSLGSSGTAREIPIVRTVATTGDGIAAAIEAIRQVRQDGSRPERQRLLWRARLREILRERLLAEIPPAAIDAKVEGILDRTLDPYTAAGELLESVVTTNSNKKNA
jgi:LAO/AO transport system kinase